MKIESEFSSHLNIERDCSFWLIPAIEIGHVHFETMDFGELQWVPLMFSWLFWSLDVRWIIKGD